MTIVLIIPYANRGQSACLFNHLLSTILETMQNNLANGPSENLISASESFKGSSSVTVFT